MVRSTIEEIMNMKTEGLDDEQIKSLQAFMLYFNGYTSEDIDNYYEQTYERTYSFELIT